MTRTATGGGAFSAEWTAIGAMPIMNPSPIAIDCRLRFMIGEQDFTRMTASGPVND